HTAALLDLPVAALVAELAHGFHLVIPPLHVALREMPAAGVDRQPAVEAQAVLARKRHALSRIAETEAFQREQHVTAEAVIDLKRIDVRWTAAGHAEGLSGGEPLRRKVEIEQARLEAGGAMVEVGTSYALDMDRRFRAA